MGEQLPVVSLFSGAGGLDLAVERADAEPLVGADPGSDEAVRAAVAYVGGMTDRYAFESAVRHLDWPRDQLPPAIDTY